MNEELNDVLNHYWETVGEDQDTNKIRGNRHLTKLNKFFEDQLPLEKSIVEDVIPCKYKSKKWDIHFPKIKVAIEYKSMSAKNIESAKTMRIEEALGCAVDLRNKNSDYTLGYVIIFAFKEKDKNIIKARDWFIEVFDHMVDDGYYDMFFPIETRGIDDHHELSEKYSLDSFINRMKYNIPQSTGKLNLQKRDLMEFFTL